MQYLSVMNDENDIIWICITPPETKIKAKSIIFSVEDNKKQTICVLIF